MADLFAFIDVQAQAKPTQQKPNPSSNSSSKNDNNSKRAGFFDSLVNEYSASKDIKKDIKPVNTENTVKSETNESELTAFNGKLFSNSVIEVLADENSEELLNIENPAEVLKNSLGKVKDSMPEVLYDDGELKLSEEISEILAMNDEELNALLESLPEDLRSEVKNLINEINKVLENGSDMANIESSAEKLSDLILSAKHEDKIKPEVGGRLSAEKISEDDSDDDEEIKTDESQAELNAANNAGLASIQNGAEKPADSSEPKTENAKNSDVVEAEPRKNSKVPVQNQNVQDENKAEVQADPEQKFRNLIRERTEENSQNESENANQNQESDFNQGENFFDRQQGSDPHNQSRSRNDNRRISNDNSREYERNQTANNRTDTRNDFQSFFDGVLNSRGTSSANSSQPLNLRGNMNLNQSETLREGLTNVVRFIRADGVQKASVIIDPPALGRISVELTSSSSGVEASIKVASEQIRQLVQDQLTQLRMNLSEQGVQVAEFTVDVQQDNQFNDNGNSQNQEQQDNRGNFTGVDETEDDTEEFRIDLEEGLLYWVA